MPRLPQKLDLTFRDVVAAEGRNEASRVVRERLAATDTSVGELDRLIEQREGRMEAAVSKRRADAIRSEFLDRLTDYSQRLNVRLDDRKKSRLSAINVGRGSEGPRALLAYYYAFLQTARKHSSSAFCPIVLDAPNQQGQDAVHMPRMMQFIVDECPAGAQLIIAAENLFGLTEEKVDVINVGGKRDQVLREEQYHDVAAAVRRYLGQLL